MTAAQKERQWTRIIGHGNDLLALFPNATEREPDELCKKLRRLERKANLIALRLCNGPEFPGGSDQVDRACDQILGAVNKLLGNYNVETCPPARPTEKQAAVPVFLNRDPRGYALKIRDEWMREHHCKLYQDWGGYGILAPEINGRD